MSWWDFLTLLMASKPKPPPYPKPPRPPPSRRDRSRASEIHGFKKNGSRCSKTHYPILKNGEPSDRPSALVGSRHARHAARSHRLQASRFSLRLFASLQ